MALTINQHRRVANLLNRLDLLANRHLKALGEPFHLTLQELWLWRERLRIVAEEWDKLHQECTSVLADAALLHQVLQPAEDALSFALVEYIPNEERAQAEEAEWQAEEAAAEAAARAEESGELAGNRAGGVEDSGSPSNEKEPEAELPRPDAPLLPEDPDAVGAAIELTEEDRVAIYREELLGLKTRLQKVIQLIRAWSQREAHRFLP